MSIRIVRLGTRRRRGEGLRLGTVRRPPRGVPKTEYARQDWYDVWLPALAPSVPLLRTAAFGDDLHGWTRFERRYRAEMSRGDAARLLDLLAALSHSANFAVGCYCEDERSCHRSILRTLLEERGARIVG
jgi:uncharacterized protein YeaO (DUF488 family)